MALVAINMDTTAPGTSIVNLGLMARQQTFLILGCALFLGGLVLFAVHKTRQTKEEEQEEARATRERIQKVTAVIDSWKERGDQRVAEIEARRSARIRDPDRRPVQRLLAGLLTGVTCFFVGVGATGSFGLGGILFFAAIVYAFWQGNGRVVIRRLMLANIAVASSLYCYGLLTSSTSMQEPQFIVATCLLFLLPLSISLFVLLKPERPRSSAGD